MAAQVHAVTGAFGYSGRHIAARLRQAGRRAVTLTGHPDRPDHFGGRVEVRPVRWDDPAALRRALRAAVLFRELVRLVARATGSRARLAPVPRAVSLPASRLVGLRVGDLPLTPDEVDGLAAGHFR